jgi:hypothetical protein
MSTLGNILVKLEASTAQFSSGIKKAEEGLQSLHSMAGKLKGALFAGLAIAGVGLGVDGIKNIIETSMTAAKSAWNMSSALGMSTESLMGLQIAAKHAGVDTEAFNSGLNKMAKNIGEAAINGGSAAEKLSRLGLNAKDLANMGMDKAFSQIASKIGSIQNPAERAAAMVELFGKGGQALAPMFMEGAEGIEKAKQAAIESGAAMKDIDAAKLVAAHEEMEKIGERVEGIKNQFTIALAPVLSEMAKKILDLLPCADKMRNIFIDALRNIAKAVAAFMDVWTFFKIGVLTVIAGVEWALYGVIKYVEMVANSFIWLHNKVSSDQWEDVHWGEGIRKEAENTWATIKDMASQPLALEKVDAFFDGIQDAANKTAEAMVAKKPHIIQALVDGFDEGSKKIKSIMDELQKSLDEFGMTAGQKKLFELKSLGAKPEEIKQAENLIRQLERLENQKKTMEEGNKIFEEMKTPMEKYQDQIGHIDDLLMAGVINSETYDRAVAKYQDELLKGDKDKANKTGASTRRFEFALPEQAKLVDPMKEQLAVAKESHREQVMQTKALQQIANSEMGMGGGLAVARI